MKLRELEAALQQVEGFRKPKIKLEQYPTSAHIAAHVLFEIESRYGDLEGRSVADLGCGCGVLGVGARLLGADVVVGVDVDADALAVARDNCERMELELGEVELLQADVVQEAPACLRARGIFDTVVMNPPFGTKTKGADMAFVCAALRLAPVVYSLHKSSTRAYVLSRAEALGAEAEVLAQLRWDIPAMYRCHTRQSVDIEVDFVRFERNDDTDGVSS
eukprot:TRINITY_DN3246_c0_g1_i1.p2 TRINITY_DN3246_c0_g1~~TRINITY_DN3246_c0_g1_i1.p2  ORF type:complete len:219 (-),score=81.16 TRINITY_DN3246_c0_g1_i1:66-722(-)